MGITDSQARLIVSTVARFHPGATVYLYGSRARADYKPGSDIDLSVLLHVEDDTIGRYDTQLNDSLTKLIGITCNAVLCRLGNAWNQIDLNQYVDAI